MLDTSCRAIFKSGDSKEFSSIEEASEFTNLFLLLMQDRI